MKKIGYVFAALSVIAIAAPSIASAETVVVKEGHRHMGARAEFRKRLELKAKPRRLVTALGAAGYLARSAVITLIGVFLVFAALHANAHEATGLAGALLVIKGQAYGTVLLAVTALGFLAFGAYGLAEALYRRIDGQCITARLPAWMGV